MIDAVVNLQFRIMNPFLPTKIEKNNLNKLNKQTLLWIFSSKMVKAAQSTLKIKYFKTMEVSLNSNLQTLRLITVGFS